MPNTQTTSFSLAMIWLCSSSGAQLISKTNFPLHINIFHIPYADNFSINSSKTKLFHISHEWTQNVYKIKQFDEFYIFFCYYYYTTEKRHRRTFFLCVCVCFCIYRKRGVYRWKSLMMRVCILYIETDVWRKVKENHAKVS